MPDSKRTYKFEYLLVFIAGASSVLYLDLFEVFGETIRPVQLVPLFAAMIGIIIVLLPRTKRDSRFPIEVFLFAFSIFCAARFQLSTTSTYVSTSATRALVNMTIAFGLSVIMIRRFSSNLFLFGMVLGALVSICCSAFALQLGDIMTVDGRSRWQGFMPDANRFGNVCAMSCIVALNSALVAAGWKRKTAMFLVLAACIGGVLMSGSRGALLSLSIVALLYVFLYFRITGRVFKLLTVVVYIAITVVVVVSNLTVAESAIAERLFDISSMDRLHSTVESNERVELQRISWEMFVENPLFGLGERAEFFHLGGQKTSSHSTYLFFLSTTGLIGFILYAVMILLLFVGIAKSIRRTNDKKVKLDGVVVALCFLVIVIHSFAITLGTAVHTWCVIATGLAYAHRRGEKS